MGCFPYGCGRQACPTTWPHDALRGPSSVESESLFLARHASCLHSRRRSTLARGWLAGRKSGQRHRSGVELPRPLSQETDLARGGFTGHRDGTSDFEGRTRRVSGSQPPGSPRALGRQRGSFGPARPRRAQADHSISNLSLREASRARSDALNGEYASRSHFLPIT